jgi:hypothetical protein
MSSSSSHPSPYPVPPGNFPYDACPHARNPAMLRWESAATFPGGLPQPRPHDNPPPRPCDHPPPCAMAPLLNAQARARAGRRRLAWGNEPKLELEREPATTSSSIVGGHRTHRRGRMTTTTTASPVGRRSCSNR